MMEIEEIRNRTEFLNISYNGDEKTLNFDSNMSPRIIDNNFNELENRINGLEDKIKSLETKLNKMMFNYTSI